jgi:hypothetical protein
VQGLVLAGGASVGTPDGINAVIGTHVCNPASDPPDFNRDSSPVPLSAQGNAEFDGSLGPLPSNCTPTNVAFLVRIAANGLWIGNGAVRSSSGGQ